MGNVDKPVLHRAMTRYGEFQTLDPAQDLISKFLHAYGEWAQNEIVFVAANIPDHARVADIGAFVGSFGIGLSQERVLENVCFVDANPAIIPVLTNNARRCAKGRFDVREAIIGGASPSAIGMMYPGNAGSFSLAQTGEKDRQEKGRVSGLAACSAYTVAQLEKECGPFDLVKVDAEGMEGEILRSSLDFFHRFNGKIWLECNESPSSLDLVDLLHSAGFSVYYYAFPAIAQNNFNGRRDREYPFAYEAGLWGCKGDGPTLPPSLAEQGCVLKEIPSRESLRRALWLTPRWSPQEWDQHSLPEVVALASRQILGQQYGNYLDLRSGARVDNEATGPTMPSMEQSDENKSMIEALHAQLEAEREKRRLLEAVESERAALENRVNEQRDLLSQAAVKLRASEILLHEERIRFQTAAESMAAERRDLLAHLDSTKGELDRTTAQLQAMYGSRSWRAMMPARMIGRIMRGDWKEVVRLIKAKL
ncbi:hypothetical protein CAL14_19665 [Bordetella genomosp. 9]|uniref:hypothetical protein n=1 Tax=Bordetella genomosp. 9 TaxID=1416803 RepID=UPI000A2923F6|nr:hypothetical protein [Bordetella genomosp. 9]ARP92226.1 hypothetical protein CAL14_19665 [Bordetella genomosp. 9]